jgi:hypothetical protein
VAQTQHQKGNESYFSPSQINESGIPSVSLPYFFIGIVGDGARGSIVVKALCCKPDEVDFLN